MRHNNSNAPPYEITPATADKEVVASFQCFPTKKYPLPYQLVKILSEVFALHEDDVYNFFPEDYGD